MPKCRGCQAEIVWVKTVSGSNMPADPDLVSIITVAGELVRGHIPHFVTCPEAARFKRGGWDTPAEGR